MGRRSLIPCSAPLSRVSVATCWATIFSTTTGSGPWERGSTCSTSGTTTQGPTIRPLSSTSTSRVRVLLRRPLGPPSSACTGRRAAPAVRVRQKAPVLKDRGLRVPTPHGGRVPNSRRGEWCRVLSPHAATSCPRAAGRPRGPNATSASGHSLENHELPRQ